MVIHGVSCWMESSDIIIGYEYLAKHPLTAAILKKWQRSSNFCHMNSNSWTYIGSGKTWIYFRACQSWLQMRRENRYGIC